MTERISETTMEVTTTKETYTITRLGTLGDFNLGSEGGIYREMNPDQTAYFEANFTKAVTDITDKAHNGCIDGRRVIGMLDGAKPGIRGRQGGGSLAFNISAMVGGASVLDTIPSKASLDEIMASLDDRAADLADKLPCSHTGTCGAAVKLDRHLANMLKTGNHMAVSQLVSGYSEYFETDYDEETMARNDERAAALANKIDGEHWQGSSYTEQIAAQNPGDIEDLVWDEQLPFHGHAEAAIVIIIGNKSIDESTLAELGLPDVFVITAQESIVSAQALSGVNQNGYTAALLANLSFHFAIADTLADKRMPVYVIDTRQLS